MAKAIKINGASFSDVPSIRVPLANGTGYANFIDEDDVQGGGSVNVESITATGSGTTSISFSVKGKPIFFELHFETQFNSSATRIVTNVSNNGTSTFGCWNYQSNNKSWGINYFSNTYFSYTYTTNGTLTIKSSSSTNGGVFRSSTTYRLTYGY